MVDPVWLGVVFVVGLLLGTIVGLLVEDRWNKKD